jgi:hypothetical protein
MKDLRAYCRILSIGFIALQCSMAVERTILNSVFLEIKWLSKAGVPLRQTAIRPDACSAKLAATE